MFKAQSCSRLKAVQMAQTGVQSLMQLGNRRNKAWLTVFAQELYPSIKDDYEELLKAAPLRVHAHAHKEKKVRKEKEPPDQAESAEKDPIERKMDMVLQEVREKKERRHCYLNLLRELGLYGAT